MCPLCDEKCDFWYLRDTCNAARAFFLFDNGATVFFAAFMALWGKLCSYNMLVSHHAHDNL